MQRNKCRAMHVECVRTFALPAAFSYVRMRSTSPPLRMTVTSTLEPEPRSLKMPARMASRTNCKAAGRKEEREEREVVVVVS